MSKKVNSALDRRSAIRIGAVGAAATAATVATASNAEAAAGQAVLQGRVNTVGTAGTTLSSNGTAVTLTVKNTGAGAAAFFFGQNNNGFAGGTGAGNKYGLSAANTGAEGGGAAMAASGNNNTGILANTGNSELFAIEATNLADVDGFGGAVYADGGLAGVGLFAYTWYLDIPAVETSGDVWLFDGGVERGWTTTTGVEVTGITSANGAEVTFSGTEDLDGAGSATAQIPAALVEDLDLSAPVSLATPNSGPMPNLWVTTNASGLVSISGGVASGSVSYRIVAKRSDVAVLDPGTARSSQRASGADAGRTGDARAPKRFRKG